MFAYPEAMDAYDIQASMAKIPLTKVQMDVHQVRYKLLPTYRTGGGQNDFGRHKKATSTFRRSPRRLADSNFILSVHSLQSPL